MLPSLSPLGTERTSFPILCSSPKNIHVTVSCFEHHVTVSSPENPVTVFLWLGYILHNNPQTQNIHTKDNVYNQYFTLATYRDPRLLEFLLWSEDGVTNLFLLPTVSFPIYAIWIFSASFAISSYSPSVCSMASTSTNIPFSSRVTGYHGGQFRKEWLSFRYTTYLLCIILILYITQNWCKSDNTMVYDVWDSFLIVRTCIGSQHPFRSSTNYLYPPDYKEAFAFSNMLYPLDHSIRLLDSYRYTSEPIGLTKFRLIDFQQLF